MQITLEGVPPSLNRFAGRENTWAYRAAKTRWTSLCAAKALPHRPPKPFDYALVRIDYFFPNRIRRDADNYSGKLFMDGLTKAGVIADDSLDHIAVAIHGHVDKAHPRTEITVLEVPR